MLRSLRYRGSGHAPDKAEEEESLLAEDSSESKDEQPTSARSEYIPWKGILLAVILTLIGTFMSGVYLCSLLGVISYQPEDSISFLILAFITLVPGCYHCFIAWKALRGEDGYQWGDIADLN